MTNDWVLTIADGYFNIPKRLAKYGFFVYYILGGFLMIIFAIPIFLLATFASLYIGLKDKYEKDRDSSLSNKAEENRK